MTSTINPTTNSTTDSILGTSVLSGIGGEVPFTPAALSSLLAWYDPSDESTISETTASGRVAQIDDKSGNEQHLKCNVASNQPRTGVNTMNGLNVISNAVGAVTYLDTVGDKTGSLLGLDANDFEIHIVHKLIAGQSTESLITLKAAFGGDILISNWRDASGTITPEDANNYWFAGQLFASDTDWNMGFGMTTTETQLYRNGVTVATQDPLPAAPSPFDRFLIMARATGSGQFFGDVGEIVVTNRLSTEERTELNTYLNAKWLGI